MSPNPKHYSLIIQWSNSDQAYIVTIPELPECKTYGETREKAARKAQDAIEGWLKEAKDLGWPVPQPHLYNAQE